MGELKKVFRPEFLNRIDDVIVFHKLTREEIKTIVDLLLRRIRASLAERELQLDLTEAAEDLLVEKGWDPSMGARPLRRAIQRYIEDPLADFVLRAELVPGATVLVEPAAEDEEGEMRLSIVKPEKQPVAVGGREEGADEGKGADETRRARPARGRSARRGRVARPRRPRSENARGRPPGRPPSFVAEYPRGRRRLDDMHRTGIPPVVMAYAVMVVLLLLPALVGALG